MSSYIFRDADAVKAEINRLLTDYPEIAEDTQLLADSIEGETSLHKILDRALSARQEAVSMVYGIKEREADLEERRKRYEQQAEAYKTLMLSLMQYASQDKVTLTEATLSITKPRSSVVVDDENELSQGFYKNIRVADKSAIKSAIDKGEMVHGASLKMGPVGLSVRTK